jgi:hypothetical protein
MRIVLVRSHRVEFMSDGAAINLTFAGRWSLVDLRACLFPPRVYPTLGPLCLGTRYLR